MPVSIPAAARLRSKNVPSQARPEQVGLSLEGVRQLIKKKTKAIKTGVSPSRLLQIPVELEISAARHTGAISLVDCGEDDAKEGKAVCAVLVGRSVNHRPSVMSYKDCSSPVLEVASEAPGTRVLQELRDEAVENRYEELEPRGEQLEPPSDDVGGTCGEDTVVNATLVEEAEQTRIEETTHLQTTVAVTALLKEQDALSAKKVLTQGMVKKRFLSRKGMAPSLLAKDWMRKVSHIHLEELGITHLGQSFGTHLEGLKVLYGYENRLVEIETLPPKLEALYLQTNLIRSVDVELLQSLRCLKILNLSNNLLTTNVGANPLEIVGLDALEEVNLSKNPGLSRMVLEGCPFVRTLDLSGCAFHDCKAGFESVRGLKYLTKLQLQDNILADVPALCELLMHCDCLNELNVHPNPFTLADIRKYKQGFVLILDALMVIDGKQILEKERECYREIFKKKHQS